MEFIAFLGNDTESWGQVTALINKGDWENIIIIKNKQCSSFPTIKDIQLIEVDSTKKLLDLKKEIMDKVKGKIKEFEASVSVASGNGKEHMALISALLSIPVGIRLVAYTKNGVEFIN